MDYSGRVFFLSFLSVLAAKILQRDFPGEFDRSETLLNIREIGTFIKTNKPSVKMIIKRKQERT